MNPSLLLNSTAKESGLSQNRRKCPLKMNEALEGKQCFISSKIMNRRHPKKMSSIKKSYEKKVEVPFFKATLKIVPGGSRCPKSGRPVTLRSSSEMCGGTRGYNFHP